LKLLQNILMATMLNLFIAILVLVFLFLLTSPALFFLPSYFLFSFFSSCRLAFEYFIFSSRIIKIVPRLAFSNIVIAFATVSQSVCWFIFGIDLMAWLNFMARIALYIFGFISRFKGGLHCKGLSEDVGRFMYFIFYIFMYLSIKIGCFKVKSLSETGVLVW